MKWESRMNDHVHDRNTIFPCKDCVGATCYDSGAVPDSTKPHEKVLREYVEFALATFTEETIEGAANHLLDETRELGEAPDDPFEHADVAFLAIYLYHRVCAAAEERGIDMQDAMERKLRILKGRRWSLMPDGSYRHLKF
jgi:dATP/dGTP diphosphohydrolase